MRGIECVGWDGLLLVGFGVDERETLFRRNGVKDDAAVTRGTRCDFEFFMLAYCLEDFLDLILFCEKLGKCCCGTAGGGEIQGVGVVRAVETAADEACDH